MFIVKKSISILWLSDAYPKAQGQELVASRWTGRLYILYTYSSAVEWFELQILVDRHSDLRPFY